MAVALIAGESLGRYAITENSAGILSLGAMKDESTPFEMNISDIETTTYTRRFFTSNGYQVHTGWITPTNASRWQNVADPTHPILTHEIKNVGGVDYCSLGTVGATSELCLLLENNLTVAQYSSVTSQLNIDGKIVGDLLVKTGSAGAVVKEIEPGVFGLETAYVYIETSAGAGGQQLTLKVDPNNQYGFFVLNTMPLNGALFFNA